MRGYFEEMIRKILLHPAYVISNRGKMLMGLGPKQEFQFCLMNLKPVNLLMIECNASGDCPWVEEFPSGGA